MERREAIKRDRQEYETAVYAEARRRGLNPREISFQRIENGYDFGDTPEDVVDMVLNEKGKW